MRSLVYSRFGEPADVLTCETGPMPEPGPGQVRIKTTLAAIHNHDVMTVAGRYGYKPALPAIGGTEGTGVVDALGSGVTGLAVGQRVTASGTGVWAEYFLAAAAGVVPLDDAVSDEAAAQLIAMPLSALALLETLAVPAGAWLVQNAANGAVGKALDHFARARGVKVLGLVRREAGVAEAGGMHVVSTADAGWRERVAAIVGDAPVVAAVDSVGGGASNEVLGLLSPGGTLLAFGAMSGEPMQLDPGVLIFKNLTVKGFWLATVLGELSPETRTRLFGELVGAARAGSLPLPVDGIYAFDDVVAAFAAHMKPGRNGKILLRP